MLETESKVEQGLSLYLSSINPLDMNFQLPSLSRDGINPSPVNKEDEINMSLLETKTTISNMKIRSLNSVTKVTHSVSSY